MQTWELIPYKSVGPICFTDTREDIIKKLGEPKEISRTGEFLTYDDFLICLSEDGNVEDFLVMPAKNTTIKCKKIHLNNLDYKRIVKDLFIQSHKIYGNFSSFPGYIDKDFGIGFITHESDLGELLTLSSLQIFSRKAMPDFNDKKLCPDDILITREDQII